MAEARSYVLCEKLDWPDVWANGSAPSRSAPAMSKILHFVPQAAENDYIALSVKGLP